MKDDLISREKTLYQLATSAVYYFDLEEDTAAHNWAMHIVSGMPDEEPEWISVKERLPKDNVPVNITWINRNPEPYYKSIKDVPFTATGVYFKGKWYWYSSTVEDYLAEYGRAEWDEIEETMAGCIEVTAWMPLPEPYAERSE